MTKKRLFLYTVIVGCIATLVFALSRPENQAAPGQNGAAKGPQRQSDRKEIHNFRMPSVSPSGLTEWVATGERALQVGLHTYDIFKLSIELFPGVNVETGEQQVVRLTGDTGSIDQLSKRAWLRENVVVHLDKDTTIRTSDVAYNPDDKTFRTDKAVHLAGRDIRIDGRGLAVDIPGGRATVPHDVVVHLANVKGRLLSGREKPASGHAATATAAPAQEVQIRCTGRLVIQRESNSAAFHEDVEVTYGAVKLSADEMLVFFDPTTRQPTSIVAMHNVTVRDPQSSAHGSKLTWDATSQVIALQGDPMVVLLTRQMTLRCERATYYEKEQELVTDGGGYLVTRPQPARSPSAAPARGSDDVPVEIVWRGPLTYKRTQGKATFRDSVKVVRHDGILHCDELVLTIVGKDMRLQRVRAATNVSLMQGQRTSTGSLLLYTVDDGVGVLSGSPYAEARERDVVLRSQTLRFSEKDQTIAGEGPGRLTTPGQNEGSPNATPSTLVRWDGSMQQHGDRVVFRKHVVATRGDSTIKGEYVEARLNDERELTHIHANGDVTIHSPGRTAWAQELDWGMSDGALTLTGAPMARLTQEGQDIHCERFRIREAENLLQGFGRGELTVHPAAAGQPGPRMPTKVTWQKGMTFDGQKHDVNFTGDVHVSRGAARLQAGRLHMLLTAENEIKELRAYDNVTVADGPRHAKGDRLRWDYATDVAELLPKEGELVQVKEPAFLLTGTRALYFCKEGRFKLIGGQAGPTPKTAATPGAQTPVKAPDALKPATPSPPEPDDEEPREPESPTKPKKPDERPVLKFYINRSKK